MKQLYYVVTYNSAANIYIRFILTAKDKEEAGNEALVASDPDARLHRVGFVCNTPAEVMLEI